MCEPLTILGAAMTVASTAITLGQQTYEIVTGIQDAPDHIKRLAVDLEGLYRVLGLLTHALSVQSQRVAANPESLPVLMITNIQELLEKCVQVFKDTSRVVQPFLDSNGNAFRNFTKSFKWEMTKKANVIHMQRTLSDYKLTLELAISSLNFINSSQTIDMVAHLQKDFRKLRRQIDNRDREARVEKNQQLLQNAVEPIDANPETYSEPMRRFLARTASVISTTSTSTRVTESIFSDDMSDITSVSEFTEVLETVVDSAKPEDTDYPKSSAAPSPKIPDNRQVDPGASERSLDDKVEIDHSSNAFEREQPPEKPKTWKRFRNRIMRNSSSPNLASVPEFESRPPTTTASDDTLSPQGSFRVMGEPDDTKKARQSSLPSSINESIKALPTRKPVPIGAELTKSMSVPSIDHQNHDSGLRPAEYVPHRAATAPIKALSSLSLQNKPYGLSQFSSRTNESDPDASGQTDRDALLSSLRRGASMTTNPADASKSTNPSTFCKACRNPIEVQRYYAIRSHTWHVQCFRCNSCKVLLQSDSSTMFLVKDDFLVCNSCAYNCQSCDRRVEDHGANDESLSGSYGHHQSRTQAPGQSVCLGLFFCHDCHKTIKNTRYARNRRGIFCLACQPQIMSEYERERREQEREDMRAVPILVE